MEESKDGELAKSQDAEEQALRTVAAVMFLAALAPQCIARQRAKLFLVLWRCSYRKPLSVIDERFGICSLEGLGMWQRLRNQEYEDLHRVKSEGLGRVLEWR